MDRKLPITRINKFFSNEDFELEIEMGREAIEGDGNFTLVLYRVDIDNSQYDSLYGEAAKNGIRFFPPVELKVVPILATPENKTYVNGKIRYADDGNLTFGIYSAQLSELDTEISVGDYIGYPINDSEIRYYSVANDGMKNFDNKHTIMGYNSAFRTIVCAPIDATEFTGV